VAGFLRIAVLAAGWGFVLAGAAMVVLYAVPDLQLADHRLAMAAALIPYGIIAWIAATVLLALAARHRAKLVALLTLTGLLVQLVWARPYWPGPRPTSVDNAMTIMSINLRCDGYALAELSAEIRRVAPGILVLQGADADTRERLVSERWLGDGAGMVFHPGADDSDCGSVVASIFALEDVTDESSGHAVVRVDTGAATMLILPVDAPTPLGGVEPWEHDINEALVAALPFLQEGVVMIGDFNAVREHLPIRRLLAAGLVSAAEQARSGWLPTFPANRSHPAVIAIDHAFISEPLHAIAVETFRAGGNSHLGLVVWLSTGNGQQPGRGAD